MLAQHFLKEFATENAKAVTGLTPDALDLLTAYRWPGNVRELRNVMERMVVLARSEKLTVRDLPANIRELSGGKPAGVTFAGHLTLEAAEKQLLIQALKQHGGNRTLAAKQIGISRRTFHRKLNEFGLRATGDETSDATQR